MSERVDVAIIGGGIVGTSAAAFLAAAGANVALYERAVIAAGASGRNSGVVQRPFDPILGALHLETLEIYRALGDVSADGFTLPERPAGLLFVGRDEVAVRSRRDAIRAAAPDLEAALLDGAALRSLEPALAPGLTAVRLDVGYPVAPAAATRAFGALARSHGARIVTGASATPLFDGERAVGVRVDGVAVAAGLVIVAAGPWSPSLVDATSAWRPIAPRWGVVVSVGLERPPGHVLEQADIATEPADGDPTDGVEFSLVTAGGTSSVGSTFLPDEPEPSAWAPRIIRAVSAFVPEIGRAPVLGYRTCARPQSLDGRPLVGAVPGRRALYVAAGHGPWGISTGPASARRLAQAILGHGGIRGTPDAVDSACDPSRFGPP
jgi:D-hydroxyproline dehydrogenase subunit beta